MVVTLYIEQADTLFQSLLRPNLVAAQDVLCRQMSATTSRCTAFEILPTETTLSLTLTTRRIGNASSRQDYSRFLRICRPPSSFHSQYKQHGRKVKIVSLVFVTTNISLSTPYGCFIPSVKGARHNGNASCLRSHTIATHAQTCWHKYRPFHPFNQKSVARVGRVLRVGGDLLYLREFVLLRL